MESVKETKIELIAASYICGNITLARKQVKRLTKLEFIDLLEHLRGCYGKKPYEVRNLVS